RLHLLKIIAKVILPFSVNEDEKSINKFLKIIAQNDKRVRISFEQKKLGGYINLNITNSDKINSINNEANIEIDDAMFKYDMVYNSLGNLTNMNEIFNYKKHLLLEYVEFFKKVPSKKTIYKNVRVGIFLQNLKKNLGDKNSEIYKM